ncbi:hypothetical protein [Microbispora sp. CA-102843]|uniref:hypothetical protein n=1 Tax=Microbispora sp. CA-102843 TaxID=3239952 RepID=UPI003D903FBA
MTPSDDTAVNVAAGNAHVDVQGIVHGGVNYYTTPPDPSPREKFEAGLRYLESGVTGRAWPRIDDAVLSGYRTNRACFYWLLALLSGRTRRELSDEEAARLQNSDHFLPLSGDDPWAEGARTMLRLVESVDKPYADLRVLMKEFDELPSLQRDLILRHLELFLEGPIKDDVWHRALQRACDEQMDRNREGRVWKFFEPTPATPLVRQPAPVAISTFIWLQAGAGAVVAVAATAHLGHLLVQGGRVSALFAYLLSIAGGCFAARGGMEWCFRSRRLRMKDEEHSPTLRRGPDVPLDAFARQVGRRLEYYLAKYRPSGMEPDLWLTWTAGLRRSMRNELVEAYREEPTKAETINWLIRHRAIGVKTRWEKGTLWNHRQELATPISSKATAVLGALACAIGGIWAASGAMQAGGLIGIRSVALFVVAGWIAGRAWLLITLERRRFAADKLEAAKLQEDSEAAFSRWKERLADRPDDREMAAWLDCDRKVLLSEALRHYQLKMSGIIAYAFIEARSGSATRARVPGGPWRYRKYQLIVFLLTADGVRQLTATLDLQPGTFHDRHRMNYRFEAVAAVRVRQADNQERTFQLSLVNGQEINVKVVESEMEDLQQGENPAAVSEVTLDAAGLRHTLHVLEGIAAEGKAWITSERRRGEARSEKLWPRPPDKEPNS